MQEVILLILFIVIIVGIGTIIYAYYLESGYVSTELGIAKIAYSNIDSILSISNLTSYTCTNILPFFSVYSTGVISIPSSMPYSKAVSYSGGVPSEGTIYYSDGNFFILSPYPIVSGNYTDSQICVIPSAKVFQIIGN